MIRNIIFDWSGTLVDDLPAVLAATNYVFEQAGVEKMSLDRFRAEFCLPFKNFYDRFIPQVPLAQLEKSFHHHFATVQHAVAELPHARDFLALCQQRGVRCFLLSTVNDNYWKVQTAGNGFDQFIERAYLGVWDKRAKIAELLAENKLAASQIMFIGDMQHDIDTAKHGGVFSCAVLTGYNRLEQLRASEPDLIVEHLGELAEILERSRFELRRPGRGVEGAPVTHPISTVGGLVFDKNGKVLMIRTQKWSNLWGIPGGKIKFGEASIDALRREIKEETNLEIEDIEFVMVQDCIHSKEFYREAHFVLLNYTCRVRGRIDVKLNEEAQEFLWVAPTEAMKLKLNLPTRKLLEGILPARPALTGD